MKTTRAKLLLGAVVATTAMGFATTASAMSFKASGQVDRAVIAADNGESSDVGFVDNTGSNTRFRFTGDQAFDNGYHAGFLYEVGLGNHTSYGWDIHQNGNSTNGNFYDARHADLYISGNFGKVSLGKGSPAGDGTSEVDFSGTGFIGGGVDYIDMAGGVHFMTDHAGTNTSTGVAIGDAFNELDAGRDNRIRYDSPSMGGAVVSLSTGEGGAYQAALRYGTKLTDGTKVGAAFSYEDTQNQGVTQNPNGTTPPGSGARYKTYGGSAAILLPGGLNFAGMYKQRKSEYGNSDDAKSYFFGAGYKMGQNNFQVNWGEGKNFVVDGSKGTQIGAAYVFDWTSSVQLYASYHNYKLDSYNAAGDDAQNINVVFIGSRIKFL